MLFYYQIQRKVMMTPKINVETKCFPGIILLHLSFLLIVLWLIMLFSFVFFFLELP
jgi:hypothetical protein